MRILGKPGRGENTAAPSKRLSRGKGKLKAVKKLEKRQLSYDMLPLGARKGRRRPGSLKKG